MSELVAPAAPAAPQNGAPRNNNGQFSPKAGATGVVPQEGSQAGGQGDGAPPSGPQSVAEWEGYEGEVDVYGEKQAIKVKSKAEALRAHQELLAYRKRVRDIAEAEKRIAARERMAPEDMLRERGVDVNEIARRRVIEAARMIDMTPEQRENYELKQRLANFEQQQQTEKQRQQQALEQRAAKQRREQAVAGLEEGLKLSSLPKTHYSMGLLVEIQQECVENRLPPLPPDLLAKEAERRYHERHLGPQTKTADDFLANPTPEAATRLLERVGKSTVRAILTAERMRRGLAAAQPRQPSEQRPIDRELPTSGEAVYGEAEAEAKLRALRNRR